MHFLSWLIGVIWLVLFVVALVDILGSNKSVGGKILWLLICLIFPVVGVICYYLFGR